MIVAIAIFFHGDVVGEVGFHKRIVDGTHNADELDDVFSGRERGDHQVHAFSDSWINSKVPWQARDAIEIRHNISFFSRGVTEWRGGHDLGGCAGIVQASHRNTVNGAGGQRNITPIAGRCGQQFTHRIRGEIQLSAIAAGIVVLTGEHRQKERRAWVNAHLAGFDGLPVISWNINSG